MQAHVTARIAGDVDTVIASYSEDWRDSKGFTKDSLREGHLEFTTGAMKAEVKINLDTAKTTVDEDHANFGPVVIDTEKGRITYSYKLRKEQDGIWRLIFTKTVNWEPFPMDETTQAMKDEIDHLAMTVRRHREQLLADPGDRPMLYGARRRCDPV